MTQKNNNICISLLLFVLVCVALRTGYLLHGFFNTYTTDTTDTIEVVKTDIRVDTVYQYRPQYYANKIVDTIYVPCNNDVCEIPIEQVEYIDSLYHLWISGYHATVDSIQLYKWTKYVERIKTVTTTKVVQDTKGKFFVGIGVQKCQTSYIPSVDLYYTKKDFLIGVTAGLFDNKPIYGVNVNYKLR